MISESLSALRVVKGISQEKAAEIAGVSRQAYARWEKGETIPDVERCGKLADFYGTTVDAMMRYPYEDAPEAVSPAPAGKHIWGTVTVGERGQIVIPKAARDVFGIKAGSRLVVLGDESEGIALVSTELFEERMNWMILEAGRLGE